MLKMNNISDINFTNKPLSKALDKKINYILHNGYKYQSKKDTTIALHNDIFTFGFCNQYIQVPKHFTISVLEECILKRSMNLKFAIAEAAYILAGRNDIALANDFEFMKKYADNNKMIGSYGPYFKEQLVDIIRALRNNKHTRQAVIAVWPIYDKSSRSSTCVDVPCTNNFTFYVKADNTLNLTVLHRSSDVLTGLMYDVVLHQILLQIVAAYLNLEVGSITNIAINRHVYVNSGINSIPDNIIQNEIHASDVMCSKFNFYKFVCKEVFKKNAIKTEPYIYDVAYTYNAICIYMSLKDITVDILIKNIFNKLYECAINGTIKNYIDED